MHYTAVRLAGGVATPGFGPAARLFGLTNTSAPAATRPASAAPPTTTSVPVGAFDAIVRSFEAELHASLRAIEAPDDDEAGVWVMPM